MNIDLFRMLTVLDRNTMPYSLDTREISLQHRTAYHKAMQGDDNPLPCSNQLLIRQTIMMFRYHILLNGI